MANRRYITKRRPYWTPIPLTNEYHPAKEPMQLYEEFVEAVELEYGKFSKKLRVAKRLIQDCREYRTSVVATRLKMNALFKDCTKLSLKCIEDVLPYLYPLRTTVELDRANQFVQRVESAFQDIEHHYSVICLIMSFQDGMSDLKETTLMMLKCLENKDELIEAYIKFMPEAEEYVIANASNVSIRRFMLYIMVFTVALGIGLYVMKK